MARSRRTSPFEDVVSILSRLPWWGSLLIGLIAWAILSPIAASPPPAPNPTNPMDMSGILVGQALRTGAMFGQYLIPMTCLIAALISVVRSKQRKKLLVDVKSATQPARTIDGLSWQQFEQLIGEAFRKQGYSITETGGQGADGGIDLVLRKGGEKYIVQCKHWRSLKVGVPVIREFFGAMAVEGAAGGFVVTSGQFTGEAQAFAEGRNIKLIDGAGLKRLFALPRQPAPSTPVSTPAFVPPQPAHSTEPVCPVCRGAMVQRTAKRGANAGNRFWDCSQYPSCRGIVNI